MIRASRFRPDGDAGPASPANPDRRAFLRRATLAGASLLLQKPVRAFAQGASAAEPPADYTLEIAPLSWEIATRKTIRTTAYGGQVPGRLVRLVEGRPVTIDIVNRLDRPEIVHWHGQWIPPAFDGAMEEGTPMIPPDGRTRIQFTPRPSGLHWYHTHVPAHRDLKTGLYSGQFGPVLVEPRDNPGRYDQEEFLLLHEWEPYLVASDDGSLNVAYDHGTINGRKLGFGDPIRVESGRRVLFHILNASATLAHWLSMPGHRFQVLALDGRPVPTAASVETLRLGPAERISAVVAMDRPGVWVLGEARRELREAGAGIVVEYAGQSGKPQAADLPAFAWDYRAFGDPTPALRKPDITVPLVFTSKFEGHGAMDRWRINGKSFPDTDPVMLKEGLRHRLAFDNRSQDDHPVHLHRHAFELVSIQGKPTSGVFKDVVIVNAGSVVEADLVAANPGPSLFHCHQQDHMDMGFMTLFRYA